MVHTEGGNEREEGRGDRNVLVGPLGERHTCSLFIAPTQYTHPHYIKSPMQTKGALYVALK